jgi:hypothetical protein
MKIYMSSFMIEKSSEIASVLESSPSAAILPPRREM